VEEPADCLETPRVLWAALTVAAAVVAVLVVREIAVRVLHPSPAFAPLTIGPPIVDTILCTVVAIFVFIKSMFGPNPLRTWRLVATVVLILSFTPEVLLAWSHSMGASWSEAFALMTMHVVVWALCVTLLPAVAIARHPRKTHTPDRPLSIL
jgi:protein-S-isoprenylcysteine O-methyltransferase Ste14